MCSPVPVVLDHVVGTEDREITDQDSLPLRHSEHGWWDQCADNYFVSENGIAAVKMVRRCD